MNSEGYGRGRRSHGGGRRPYGGGGRTYGGGHSSSGRGGSRPGARPADRHELLDWCRRHEGGPYPAYKDLRGHILLDGMDLEILRVQPDPFAGPSRVRLRVPWRSTALEPDLGSLAGGQRAAEPGLFDVESSRALGVRDFLGRWIGLWLERNGPRGRRPVVQIVAHGQEALDRSCVSLHREYLEVRLQLDLPARGRRIQGSEAAEALVDTPERLVREALGPDGFDPAALEAHAEVVEDFAHLQRIVAENEWISFVADGARLARRAGNDDRPLLGESVVAFASPESLRRTVRLPHAGEITGMAVPEGVTLLCGGGFHGKSTLLRAMAAGVVPHIPGDGREQVATRSDAVTVRAEDGRALTGVDLRPFIRDLPFGQPSDRFTTENASGSTSQAASIVEALEGGSRLLLIDEDTSATNFMIRDPLMERLLARHTEPITPFLQQARTLSEGLGVSSVLVIGGSGEYFRVADRVLVLDEYRPVDRTEDARAIATERAPIAADAREVEGFRDAVRRDRELPPGPSVRSDRGRGPRVKAVGPRALLFERVPLDLQGLESLRDLSQARFLADVLAWRARELSGPRSRDTGAHTTAETVKGLRKEFQRAWEREGLDAFAGGRSGELAAVRFLDLLAAVDRLRSRAAPGRDWGMEEP